MHLPSPFVGSQNILAPQQTAPSFYQAPAQHTQTVPQFASPSYANPAAATSTPASSTLAPTATVGTASVADYRDALANDPTLTSQLGVIDTQDLANTTTMQNAARRGVIDFGGVPNLNDPTLALAGLDPATLAKFGLSAPWDEATTQAAALGTSTGVSTLGRDAKAYQDAQSQYLSSLAARGALRSGALNQRGQESLLAYQQQVEQDTQQLGDFLIGLWQQWLTQRSAGDVAKANATQAALQRIIDTISARNAAAQAERDRQASIGFTGVPTVNPNTGYGIPADPYTPRDFGSGTDVNPRFVSAAQQGFPVDPYPNVPQPPVYGDNGWGSGIGQTAGWDNFPPQTFEPAYIDTGAPTYDYGQYGQSGGQEYYQSNRGAYGKKPLL